MNKTGTRRERASCKVLSGAADLIEQNGWCTGANRGVNGEYCVQGAVLAVVGLSEQDYHIKFTPVTLLKTYRVDKALGVFEEKRGIGKAWVWNDCEARNKEEVITALREASKTSS